MKKRLIGMAMAAILAMTALTGCGTAEDTSSLDSLTFTYGHLSPEPALYRGKGERHFHKSLCR